MKVRPAWLITIVVASIAVFVAAGSIPVTSANNYLCGSPWNHTAIQGIFSSCVSARTPSMILMVIAAAVGLGALIMLGIALSQGRGAQKESGQQGRQGGGAAPDPDFAPKNRPATAEQVLDASEAASAEEPDAEKQDEEEFEPFVELPDKLKWPIPATLDFSQVKAAYRSPSEFEAKFSELVAIPCVREFERGIQVPGVIIFAWRRDPDQSGLFLSVDFVQHEDIQAGRVHTFSPSTTPAVHGYCVDALNAGYFHRSRLATECQGALHGFGGDDLSLGLRTRESGDWPDECYIVPWGTGELDDDQRQEILSRLKSALAMLDRHLSSPEAIRRSDEETYI